MEYNVSMDEPAVKAGLAGLPIPEVRFFAETGSTNDVAMAWAVEGAPDGSLVGADSQTNGRGRMGRHWVTSPGAALAFSLVLRPTAIERQNIGLFSPLAGLGVAVALEGLGLAPQVKWPNDVLLSRRKVCGILAEAAWVGDQLQALVLGVGVNVASSSVPPDDQVIFPATCVETALGRSVDRLSLLRETLRAIFEWRPRLATPDFIQAWQRRLAFRGENVVVNPPNQPEIHGELVGVDDQGNLLVKAPTGEIHAILAGDVHLRPAAN
jgi:BirA family biotin operon repressor/biotin-[acetyl-CoA-carboxylase] ligase